MSTIGKILLLIVTIIVLMILLQFNISVWREFLESIKAAKGTVVLNSINFTICQIYF